jgi:crotonobetainyl-CoA:carnitine CoA-transferase CaiB-like acyl-CoA transferase
MTKDEVNEKDAEGAKARIAARIREQTADHWRPILAKADCCATIVASVEEALRDPQFADRGLFEHQLKGPSGATTMALPVPIAPGYRAAPGAVATAELGADDKLLG